MGRIHRIPPSPDVVAHLYEEYLSEARDQGFTFAQYLQTEGCVNTAEHHHGTGRVQIRSDRIPTAEAK